MKKVSSVFFMWMGFALAIVATLAMFIPFQEIYAASRSAADLFFGNTAIPNGAWPAFVGYMLLLLGGIALAIMALPVLQPSAKTEKIVLISSIAAIVVGVILISLTPVWLVEFNRLIAWNNGSIGWFLPGWYITVILGLGAAVMAVMAAKLDW